MLNEKSLDNMIEEGQQRVFLTKQLQEEYSTIDLAMIRIKKEAEKLQYIDWYGTKEIDGNYLLGLEDKEFITAIYKVILKRPAGPEDFCIMLGNLQYGSVNRIDIIDSLQASEEAKRFPAVNITGLEPIRKKVYRKRRLKNIPVLGYIFRWIKNIILIPREFAYLQEKTDNIGKQMLRNEIYQPVIQQNLESVNKVLKSYHLGLQEKKLEEQRKIYEQKMLDQFYVRYNEELFKEPRDVLKERKKTYIELLEEHFGLLNKKEIKVVDLGCGTGEWIETLQEAGYTSIGVDSNQSVVEKDRRLYPHLKVVLKDSIAYLKAQSTKSLDVITSFHMVEHMEMIEVIELCKEAARVLKPNGLLIIETPNPLNVLISSYYFYLDPTHKRQIPPELLEVYVHAGGLKVLKRIYVNPLNFIPYEYKDDDPIKDIVFRFNMEQAYSIVAVKE